jgi:hypothetical protein
LRCALRIARDLVDDRGGLRLIDQQRRRRVAERGRDLMQAGDREGAAP